MLALILGLLEIIARQTRDSTSHGTRHTICASRGQVAQLSASFLLLA